MTIRTKPLNSINVTDFGATGDGVTDDATAFTDAITRARELSTSTSRWSVFAPPGTYLINSTVDFDPDDSGSTPFYGAGQYTTRILLGMTDGTPGFQFNRNFEFYDFNIGTNENITTMAVPLGSGDTGYCVAMKGGEFGNDTTNIATRGRIRGVHIEGTLVGLECSGWLNEIDIIVANCITGTRLSYQNASILILQLENCGKYFEFSEFNGTEIPMLLIEGSQYTVDDTILTGTVSGNTTSQEIIGNGTNFTGELQSGDTIRIQTGAASANEEFTVVGVANSTSIVVDNLTAGSSIFDEPSNDVSGVSAWLYQRVRGDANTSTINNSSAVNIGTMYIEENTPIRPHSMIEVGGTGKVRSLKIDNLQSGTTSVSYVGFGIDLQDVESADITGTITGATDNRKFIRTSNTVSARINLHGDTTSGSYTVADSGLKSPLPVLQNLLGEAGRFPAKGGFITNTAVTRAEASWIENKLYPGHYAIDLRGGAAGVNNNTAYVQLNFQDMPEVFSRLNNKRFCVAVVCTTNDDPAWPLDTEFKDPYYRDPYMAPQLIVRRLSGASTAGDSYTSNARQIQRSTTFLHVAEIPEDATTWDGLRIQIQVAANVVRNIGGTNTVMPLVADNPDAAIEIQELMIIPGLAVDLARAWWDGRVVPDQTTKLVSFRAGRPVYGYDARGDTNHIAEYLIGDTILVSNTTSIVCTAPGSTTTATFVEAPSSSANGIFIDNHAINARSSNGILVTSDGINVFADPADSTVVVAAAGISIDDSTISITASQISDDITLGTDTSGDYVASFTAGTGLTGDASGQGSTPTINVVAANGIISDTDSIQVEGANGILATTDGVNVFAGDATISVTSSGVTVDESQLQIPTSSITSGDYVASFTAGTGLTGDASGTGSTPTINVVAANGIISDTDSIQVEGANGILVTTDGVNAFADPADSTVVITSAGISINDSTISITASQITDDIALGTDTSGDYVQNLTAGDGLTGTVTGEGSTPTINVVAANGIISDTDSIQVDGANGILVTTDGVNVFAGDATISVTASGVTVDESQLQIPTSSITSGDYVASFTAGTGLTGDASGTGSTPTIDVVGANGVISDTNSIQVDGANGILVTTDGVNVRSNDSTVVVDSSGVSINDSTISITASQITDDIALGTDTSGDYVQGITGTANEVEVTGSGGEGSSVTIGLPTNVTLTGNVVITNNLTVSGNTTTVNSNNVLITDPLMELQYNLTGANPNDMGFIFERGSTGDNAVFIWDESEDKFTLGTTTATGNTTGDLTVTSGTLVADLEGSATDAGVLTTDYVASFTAGAGLTGDASGVGSTPTIDVVGANGIIADTNSIQVNGANGILVTTDGVNIRSNDSTVVVDSSGVSIDDSTISITASQITDDIALGTDTSGNYVADVTGGAGLTASGSAGEGWTPVLDVGAANGVIVDTDSIQIKAGNTILVTSAGVNIPNNPTFSGNNYIGLVKGTTGEQPGSPQEGYFRYNVTTKKIEWYDGTAWTSPDTGGGEANQDAWNTFTPDSGGDVVADNSTDTATFAGANGIFTVGTPGTDTVSWNAQGANGILVTTDGINVLASDSTITVTSSGVAVDTSQLGINEHYTADTETPSVAPTATGTDSLAMGDGASATSNEGIAIGGSTVVTQTRGIAIGYTAEVTASSTQSEGIAIGFDATVTGTGSIGIGDNPGVVSGGEAIRIGSAGTATSDRAISIGARARAEQWDAITIGTAIGTTSEPLADSYRAIAIGRATRALANNTVAIGGGETIPGSDGAKASGKEGIAIGYLSHAANVYSVAIGSNPIANTSGSIAIGYLTDARQLDSIAIGRSAIVSNTASTMDAGIAIGRTALSSGDNAIAIGKDAQATGDRSFAVGLNAQATGADAFALGQNVTASGIGSIGIGDSITSTQNGSVSIGKYSDATGVRSVAIGGNSSTDGGAISDSESSIAIGAWSVASAQQAIAIGADQTSGQGAEAAGVDSIAIGNQSDTNGTASIALGAKSSSLNAGAISLGYYANIGGDYAIAIGGGTSAVDAATADGAEAIAVGRTSSAAGTDAIAIGTTSSADFDNAVSMGNASSAGATRSVAIGVSASASGSDSVALGESSSATQAGNIALGSDASATGSTSSIAIGDGANVQTNGGIGIGRNTVVSTGSYQIAIGESADATGAGSGVAIGRNSQSSGNGSVALGQSAAATTNGGFACGTNSQATGSEAVAIGGSLTTNLGAQAITGNGGVAIGARTYAGTANYATAVGYYANSSAESAIAIGGHSSDGADASGSTSIAIGAASTASGNHAIAIGGETSASGGAQATADETIAIGANSDATAQYAIAIGNQAGGAAGAQATAQGAISIGSNSDSIGTGGIAIGRYAYANSASSIAIGGTNAGTADQADAGYDDAIAIGRSVKALQSDSVAIGVGTVVNGNPNVGSVAIGASVTCSGDKSVAIGFGATASGDYAFAIGRNTSAAGLNSIAFGGDSGTGQGAEAATTDSIAIGANARALGVNSLAIGSEANNEEGPHASTTGSIAIGSQTNSTGLGSVAIGASSTSTADTGAQATGNYSISIGTLSDATTEGSIAIGEGAQATTAVDPIAIGTSAVSSGVNSIAIGKQTDATAEDAIAIGGDSGFGANASGIRSIALGKQSSSGGLNSIAIGEHANSAHDYTVTMGRFAESTETQQVVTSIVNDQTDYDAGFRCSTFENHYTVDTTNGTLTTISNNTILLSNTAMVFEATIVAEQSANNTASAGDVGDAKGWKIKGMIKRDDSNDTVIVGSTAVETIAESSGATAWTVTAIANNTIEGLEIKGTGGADRTIRWFTVVRGDAIKTS